jgi:hypothetical protein
LAELSAVKALTYGAVYQPFSHVLHKELSHVSCFKLAVALMLGLATSAYAAAGEFRNMCSWGLANHKDVPTDCSTNTTIKGKTYCFSSQEAKPTS